MSLEHRLRANQQAEINSLNAECAEINGSDIHMHELSSHAGVNGKGSADRTSNKNAFRKNLDEVTFTGVEGLKPTNRPGRSRKIYGKK